MEVYELYGVRETVPEFAYGTYIGDKLVQRKYEGHQRVIAAFANPREAEEYKKAKVVATNKSRGGYMQIHEYYYRLETEARYDVVLVDILPAVAYSPS